MPTRRARVDALTDDVTTLAEKVQALHEDLERALEEAEHTEAEAVELGDAATQEVVVERVDSPDDARADGGNVDWSEIETAGPDGTREAEQAEWTPVETE